MAKSIEDKLYFLDHIPKDIGVFVDYGCADGVLLEAVSKKYPDAALIGYDQQQKMVSIARQRHIKNAKFSSDIWSLLSDVVFLQSKGQKICLILSSVLHEVYSSHTSSRICKFWDSIFGMEFDYICIRDMGMTEADYWMKPSQSDIVNLMNNISTNTLRSFLRENHITPNINPSRYFRNVGTLYELLLKYPYQDNWNREVKERYLWHVENYVDEFVVKNSEYEVIHFEHYNLPFVKDRIFKDINIKLEYPTHFQLIVKRIK